MIDNIDREILTLLQADARMPNAEIARRVGMAPSGVFERIRKLEEAKVIRGYTARIDERAVGLGLLAFVYVRVDEASADTKTARALAKLPEVQEIHHIAGEDCYLIKVRAADTAALGRLLRDRLGSAKTIRSTRTTIVLGTVKETTALPLDGGADEAA